MNCKTVKFKELYAVDSKNGIYKSAEFHGTGTRIVNMGELFAYGFIGSQDMRKINVDDKEKAAFHLEEGDLLFARRSLVESGAGKSSIVRNLTSAAVFESSIIRVRLNKTICNPLFYYYWFKSHEGVSEISALVNGVNVKGIKSSALKEISVALPELSIQNRISGALYKYDALIENNQKQIKLLEEAAQRLYKEWFVDLRFPGYETTSVVDGVPEGWKESILGDIAENVGHNEKKQNRDKYAYYLPIECMPKKSLAYMDLIDVSEAESSLVAFRAGDILFGAMRPYFHKVVVARDDGLTRSTCFVINSKKEYMRSYLTMLLFSIDTINYATRISVGTTMPYVRWKDFVQMPVLVPTEELCVKFEKQFTLIVKKISNLAKQNISLSQARDRLLPKLMSGEIEV